MNKEITSSVNKALIKLGKEINVDLCIVNEKIKDINDYYYIIYNSKDYIESGNISSALVGNFPILASKVSSNVYIANSTDIEFEKFSLNEIFKKGFASKVV